MSDPNLELEQELENRATALGHLMSYFGPADGDEFRQSSCIICAKSVRYAPDDATSAGGGAIEFRCVEQRDRRGRGR